MSRIENILKINFSHDYVARLSRNLFSIYMIVFFSSLVISHKLIFSSLSELQFEFFKFLIWFALLCCIGTFSRRSFIPCLLCIYTIFVLINFYRFSIYQFHNSFIGLATLLFCLVPFKNKFDESDLKFFKKLQFLTLAFLSFSYTLSGLSKWLNPGWINGDVSGWIIGNYIVRPFWAEHYSHQFRSLGIFFSWPTLLVETAPLILFSFRPLRPFSWLLGVILNIGILLLLQLSQVSFILLLFHVLTFDPDWVKLLSTFIFKLKRFAFVGNGKGGCK